MAGNPIGVTFAPTNEAALQGRRNLSVSGGVPQAIQILSLHLPKFLGAKPIAPEALLTAPAGNQASAVVQSVLRELGIAEMPNVPSPASHLGTESGDLAGMLSQATGGLNRYEPLPNVSFENPGDSSGRPTEDQGPVVGASDWFAKNVPTGGITGYQPGGSSGAPAAAASPLSRKFEGMPSGNMFLP